jgi:polyisoprenoid-binding protein YceI
MQLLGRFLLGLGLAAALASAPAHGAPLWTVDEASELGFTALQQGQPVDGRFTAFAATIAFDPTALDSSRIEVEIDIASVDSGHGDRDQLLRSAAFFDVDRWPMARFVSEQIVARGGTGYEVLGQLQIRDVSEAVRLPFELVIEDHPDDPGRLLARAEGALTISRLAYGVGQGEWTSTQTVGDEVTIRIAIVASRPR